MKKLFLLFFLIPCIAFADVTVGPGMEYESFTKAVWETDDDLVVYPGIYDLREEIETMWEEPPDDFKRGVFIHDRKITFLPGSKLKCIWYRDDNWSPLYSGGNVVLDGLDLYAEGMLYAIHDDLWHWDAPYINEYRRCRIVGRKLKNANCIGGGVARNARIIIDSCWFDNGVKNSLTVRYHNTDIPDAAGDIWITNSWFNGYLGLCYYGGTSHLDVYVNGCKAEKIETRRETPDSWIRNIDLYSWNNEQKSDTQNLEDMRE